MSIGTYISAFMHAALLLWLIVGWGLQHDPLPFEVTEVSVVSGEEFEALVRATSPDAITDAPEMIADPVVEENSPAPPEQTEETVRIVEPEVAPTPTEETPPPQPLVPPDQEVDVSDTVPVLPDFQPPSAPDLPPSDTPTPREAPRVAPEPIAPPPEDTAIDDLVQESSEPSDVSEAEAEAEPVEATAPEAATTEIVTEAETPSGAPETTIRPRARPVRPSPQPQPTETVEEDAVSSALADAVSDNAEDGPVIPSGPPMSGAEEDAFRRSIAQCWNVDVGAEWTRVTVTIGFSLTREGRVDGEIRLVNAQGGDQTQSNAAFQAARRAVLRCGASGYDLPSDKYDRWREVEVTFDPSTMRLR